MRTILVSGANENTVKISKSIKEASDRLEKIDDLLSSNQFSADVQSLLNSDEIFAVVETVFGLPNSKFLAFVERLKTQNLIFSAGIKLVLVSDCKTIDLQDYYKEVKEQLGLKLVPVFIFKLPQITLTESFDFETELLNLKNSLNATEVQFSASKNKVTIYTDGACSGNPGKGGWGAILISGSKQKEFSGFDENTTNNQMELTAVIKALEALKRTCEVDLYSDSAYVVNAINNNWLASWKVNGWVGSDKKPVKNQELWQRLDELLSKHKVTFYKVKGHAGSEYNNRCDKLATGEIAKHS